MITVLGFIALCLFVLGILFMGWGLCAAAKRGDRQLEDDPTAFPFEGRK